jgi:hypothetical protein
MYADLLEEIFFHFIIPQPFKTQGISEATEK